MWYSESERQINKLQNVRDFEKEKDQFVVEYHYRLINEVKWFYQQSMEGIADR